MYGSAGSESTYKANLAAFKDYEIIPAMLRDSNQRDLSVHLFGQKHDVPLLLSPVGVQGIMHPDAELATARAASEIGVGMILSTAATRSPEKVAEANGDGRRWFQLYWPTDNEVTLSILSRVKKAGYTALVVTLDTFALGYRPRDLEASYLPFLKGEGLQTLFSDPVFMRKNNEDHTSTKWNGPGESPSGVQDQMRDEEQRDRLVEMSMNALRETSAGNYRTWDDVAFLRKNWDGPLLLKGIQSAEDAEKAIDAKVDGIIVSNHGGRQVAGAIGSLRALDLITRSKKVRESGLTILFDSGIRTGADIIKALALGAHAVCVGRPYLYALALGGQEGVEHVIRALLADLEVTMALAGRPKIQDLNRSILMPAKSIAQDLRARL